MDRNYDVITFISKYFYFKKASTATNVADIIKVATCLLEQPLKTQKKLKELEIIY